MTKTSLKYIQFCCYTILFLLLLIHANSQVNVEEQAVLLNLKQHWQNPQYLSHWTSSNSSHCIWPEIICSTDGSVTGIFVSLMEITGTVPPFICDLNNLTTLDLSHNHMNEFPRALYNCSKLQYLYLSQNSFVGKVPDDIHLMSRLRELNIADNRFSGTIPASIGRLTELRMLSLTACQFDGSFPSEIGNLSNLERLELAYMKIMPARLPSEFTKLKKLKYLNVASSNLVGEIPDMIGEMVALEHLDLSMNNLNRNVPDSIGRLPRLVNFILFDNNLSGTLPPDLGRYSMLEEFQVSSNWLTGQLPQHLCDNGMLVNVVAFDNNLSGQLPKALGSCNNLGSLIVRNNQLSGSLPSNILSWKWLTILDLSRNSFSGQIPEEFGLLPYLNHLNLAENRLSGQIPLQLGRLAGSFVNLSSNHLTGRIPSGFLDGAYVRSFLNNPDLCANSSSVNIDKCNSKSSKIPVRFLVLIICSVIATLLLPVFFVIRVFVRRKHGLDLTWELTSFQRLNFTESHILSGLTDNNAIGSGGSGKVYRVAINPSREIVAVKKIWNNKRLEQNLEKEFLAEVKILSSIRHFNIVSLLCCISSDNSKLLVYEYLENLSLDLWLNRKSRVSTVPGSVQHVILNWPKRLQIAVGAARGLSYMHHDCSPPIVHRDVKSSNILLDSEFNAKIADLGLAKMLIKEGQSATMSAVAGSFGYIAPEYAYTTRVNEKSDVYSFGVILLELTTGRKACDGGDEHTSLAEWAWRYFQEGSPIVDALDEEVKELCYLNGMCCVFQLGIICTGTLPSTRPTMKDVLKILLRWNQTLTYGEQNTASDQYDANSNREIVLENNDATFTSTV
ncbi:receptor-like protein kinase HSL1 [Corylus avellana]|uniref:receptor-like protein kinase HSL1 n=1 Tax=Corylus avellana TaxID=13451 RepID=UPI00286A1789|nr:receptor-like protein kinase HSL1 [Corylus avellana]